MAAELQANPPPTVSDPAGKQDQQDKEVQAMLSIAEANHAKPLWLQMARLVPPAPNPRCVPHLWRYDEIRPSLLRAGDLVPEQQAERRVLMLINPERDAPFTTDTLYAGLQLVRSGETARAHRHTAFAMRFIIEGAGGFTAVHGKRIRMTRGDVVLTPTWNWHDHGKEPPTTAESDSPMIWLDGLDLPNFQHFPVHFAEHFASPRYPAKDIDTETSPIVFPWERMKHMLDRAAEDAGDYVTQRYLQADGSEVSKILGGCASRVAAGKKSPLVQETASSIYHVIEGSGRSQVGDKSLRWTQGDTFCVPSWHAFEHCADENDDGTPVYLYRFDDMPMLRALGFYRSAGMDTESLVSE